MTDLFEKSIQTLELPRVLEHAGRPARSPRRGRSAAWPLRPMTDPDGGASGPRRRPPRR